MIKVHHEDINPLELLVVMDHLEKKEIEWADVFKGNQCIWVATGSSSCPINSYFIFRDGKLVDIIVD